MKIAVTMYKGSRGWSILNIEKLQPRFRKVYPETGTVISSPYHTHQINFSIDLDTLEFSDRLKLLSLYAEDLLQEHLRIGDGYNV